MGEIVDIIGQVLNGTYRVSRKLDEGGMGAVFEASHCRLPEKRFAIKMLRPEAAADKELFRRFKREAEITSKLGHPHIINVVDFHETADGRSYMVMEFLQGENLGERLRRCGPLPPEEILRLMEQVGSGLQAAHQKDIIHRDMKPENIFLVDTGTCKPLAKILDFGISKIRHGASILTRDNSLMGSPHYMSPEQASGLVNAVDQTTDIFALGSICYHGLSGKRPFVSPTLQGVLYQVCNHQQEPLNRHDPKLSPDLDRVVGKALAKKTEDRYQQVSEFLKELGQAVHEHPVDVEAIGLAVTAVSTSAKAPASDVVSDPGRSSGGTSSALKGGSKSTKERPSGSHLLSSTIPDLCQDSSLSGRQPYTSGMPLSRERSTGTRLVVVFGAMILLGGLAWGIWRSGATNEQGGPAPPVASSNRIEDVKTHGDPAIPEKTLLKEEVVVTVPVTLRGLPAGARVKINGRSMSGNPMVVKRSKRRHRLVVRANGYERFSRMFIPDRKKTIDLRLVQIRKLPAGISHPPGPASTPPGREPAKKQAGASKTKTVDRREVNNGTLDF